MPESLSDITRLYDAGIRNAAATALNSESRARHAQALSLMTDPHAFGTWEVDDEYASLLRESESLARVAQWLRFSNRPVGRYELDHAADTLDLVACNIRGAENDKKRVELADAADMIRQFRRNALRRARFQVPIITVSAYQRGNTAVISHQRSPPRNRRYRSGRGWHGGA